MPLCPKRGCRMVGEASSTSTNASACSYAQLELTHGFIRATTPVYTKYGFKASPKYKPHIQRDNSPAGKAVRLYGLLAKSLYSIDVESAAATQGIPRAEIIRKLNDLHGSGVIELKPAGVYNVYKITKRLPKTAAEIEKLVTDIHSVMEEREQQSLRRTNEMLNLSKLITSYHFRILTMSF